ncbi:MAG: hypothetical protein DMG57_03810 [Acidobacteria bacterium]|nr:MAG: hypothetical protein DMG57_03810 [Acidobacteriota bacterium]
MQPQVCHSKISKKNRHRFTPLSQIRPQGGPAHDCKLVLRKSEAFSADVAPPYHLIRDDQLPAAKRSKKMISFHVRTPLIAKREARGPAQNARKSAWSRPATRKALAKSVYMFCTNGLRFLRTRWFLQLRFQ